MANPNTPFGLTPIRYLNGAPWNGAARMYSIASGDVNAFAIGDPLMIAGGADASGIPTVTLATPGSGLLGPMIGSGGLIYGGPGAVPGALETTVIPATKLHDYYVMVVDDPMVIFEVQEIGTGTALAAADVGFNANLVAGTNSGFLSGWLLTNTTEAVTATLDVKLLGLSQRKTTTPNTFGAYAKWEVVINNHYFKAGTLGIS